MKFKKFFVFPTLFVLLFFAVFAIKHDPFVGEFELLKLAREILDVSAPRILVFGLLSFFFILINRKKDKKKFRKNIKDLLWLIAGFVVLWVIFVFFQNSLGLAVAFQGSYQMLA